MLLGASFPAGLSAELSCYLIDFQSESIEIPAVALPSFSLAGHPEDMIQAEF